MSRTILKSATALLVVAGLVFAAVASAHTLSGTKAKRAVETRAYYVKNTSGGDYVGSTVSSCKRLYPHIWRCKVGYDTRASLPTDDYECVELVEAYYRAHSENDGMRVWTKLAPHEHGC